MNHDATHCLNLDDDCPEDCFRARLTRDAKKKRLEYIGVSLSWACFRNTTECPLRPAEWIEFGATQAYCSKCLHPIDRDKIKAYRYCPWCGERMAE